MKEKKSVISNKFNFNSYIGLIAINISYFIIIKHLFLYINAKIKKLFGKGKKRIMKTIKE